MLTQNQQQVCLIDKSKTPSEHLAEWTWALLSSITRSFSQKSAGHLDGGESSLHWALLPAQHWGHSLVR